MQKILLNYKQNFNKIKLKISHYKLNNKNSNNNNNYKNCINQSNRNKRKIKPSLILVKLQCKV